MPESIELIQELYTSVPILGICLGQQLIGAAFGGNVVEAPFIRHGKVSDVSHSQQGLFKNMPLPLPVMRYHSLVLEPETLASCLEVQSKALDDDTIMAVKHKEYPVYGIQFHPESIGTPDGVELMKEFIVQSRQEATNQR
ncbi:anthranilate synthase component II [Planococcus halocryophilus]|uniref:anthranilate synthase component II n=1 Tax=Planococcus halocryophilus TaxID=1215089 RepID=UPI002E81BFC4|nr:gamma-glutamyl-gamma-aminobutyrate hydrolase family protein [Planococcus halocryophilus]